MIFNLATIALFALLLAAEETSLTLEGEEATGTGGCKPYRWDEDGNWLYGPASENPEPSITLSVPRKRGKDIKPGDVNCRWEGTIYDDITPESCQQLADDYQITLEKFFWLNPELDGQCSNIRPNTIYCTDGCECVPCELPGQSRVETSRC